jgi:hypothetical protein
MRREGRLETTDRQRHGFSGVMAVVFKRCLFDQIEVIDTCLDQAVSPSFSAKEVAKRIFGYLPDDSRSITSLRIERKQNTRPIKAIDCIALHDMSPSPTAGTESVVPIPKSGFASDQETCVEQSARTAQRTIELAKRDDSRTLTIQ